METHGMSRARVWAFRLVLLASPVLLYGISELILARKFGREYPGTTLEVQGAYRFRDAVYRGYRNNPNYVRRYDGVVYRYNNYGFRDERDVGAKKPNEYRVFFLGGSAAYGERAAEKGQYQLISQQTTYDSTQTISAYLEQDLQRLLPDKIVRVYNAAVVSYRIHHGFLTYLEQLRSLEPDLLVTMDGQNEDFLTTNPFWPQKSHLPKLGGGAFGRFLRGHSYTAFYLGLIARQSAAFDRLTGRYVRELSPEQLASMDAAEIRRLYREEASRCVVTDAVVDGVFKVYELFDLAARQDGVPIIFATQPILALDATKPLTAIEKDLLKYVRFKHYGMCGVAKLDERLRKHAKENPDFRFVSLRDVFADFKGEAYTDYCHLRPAANAYVAERLSKVIRAQIPAFAQKDDVSSMARIMSRAQPRQGTD